jgi:hypothetical protein
MLFLGVRLINMLYFATLGFTYLIMVSYGWTDGGLYLTEKLYSESLKLSKIDLSSSSMTIGKRKRFTLYRCNSSILI